MNNSAKEDLRRIMTPILSDLIGLNPGHGQNESYKLFLKWLKQPGQSPWYILFVVDPLLQEIPGAMNDTWATLHVARSSLEVVAFRAPVLQGPWEDIMWNILRCYRHYEDNSVVGRGSPVLRRWIVKILRRQDLCPDHHLRIEIVHLLGLFICNGSINSVKYKKIIRGLLAVCIHLNVRHLNGTHPRSDNFKVNAYYLVRLFEWLNFQEDVGESIIALLNKGTVVDEARCLLNLLKVSASWALWEVSQFLQELREQEKVINGLMESTRLFHAVTIVHSFRAVFNHPLFVCQASKALVDLLDAVLTFAAHVYGQKAKLKALRKCMHLREAYSFNGIIRRMDNIVLELCHARDDGDTNIASEIKETERINQILRRADVVKLSLPYLSIWELCSDNHQA